MVAEHLVLFLAILGMVAVMWLIAVAVSALILSLLGVGHD